MRSKNCFSEQRDDVGIRPYEGNVGNAFMHSACGTEKTVPYKGDCHTSDIGHWFAMTCVFRYCVGTDALSARGRAMLAPTGGSNYRAL